MFKTLLEKPMTRQEFLYYIGALVLAVVGIKGLRQKITQTLSELEHSSSSSIANLRSSGYGARTYGDKGGN